MPTGAASPIVPTPPAAPKGRELPRHRLRKDSRQSAGGAAGADPVAQADGRGRAGAQPPADGGKEGHCRAGTSSSSRSQEEPDGWPGSGGVLEAEALREPDPDQGAASSAPRRKPQSYGDDDEAKDLSMQVFQQLDIDGSGRLSCREMELAREVMMRPTTSMEVVRIIEESGGPSDVDGDGLVDGEEWHRFMCGLHGLLGRRQFLPLLRSWVAGGVEAAPAGRSKAPRPPPAEALAQQKVRSLQVPAAAPAAGGPQTARQSSQRGSCGRSSSAVPSAPARSGRRARSLEPPAAAAAGGAAAAEAGAAEAPAAGRSRGAPLSGADASAQRARSRRRTVAAGPDDAVARARSPAGTGGASEPGQAPARSPLRRHTVNSGNHVDITAVGKRSSGNHGDVMTALDTLKEHRDKQPLTTVEELWDMIKGADGHLHKDVEMGTFVELFDTVSVIDVGRALAKVVPFRKGALGYTVDMTRGRMRHLCDLLVRNANLSLLEARMALEGFDEDPLPLEENVGDEFPQDRVETRMTYKTFRRLLDILPGLMRLDEEVIVAQLAWERSGRLELPESIIVQMMMILRGMGEHNKDEVQCPSASQEMDRMWSILKGGDEGAEQEQKRQELNRQLVYRVVTLQDFMVLCRCGKIIDPTFKDTKSESLASLFLRVHKKMPELLEAHARRRRRLAPRVPSRHEQGLAGRNEMEVLMSELWALKPLASKYAGPFDLIAQMLHRQLSESFLDSAIKESAARSEAASAAAPPPARRNRSKEAAERSGMRFSTATGS